jgi:hypothetical protein
VGEEEWKGKAMNHIGDGNEMVETPRTDAEGVDIYGDAYMVPRPKDGDYVSADFARQLERELARCNNLYRKLDVHALGLCDIIRELESKLNAANETIRIMNAALECALPYCDYLHHKKAHQHASGEKCVPEELVRMAKRISTTQTK